MKTRTTPALAIARELCCTGLFDLYLLQEINALLFLFAEEAGPAPNLFPLGIAVILLGQRRQ